MGINLEEIMGFKQNPENLPEIYGMHAHISKGGSWMDGVFQHGTPHKEWKLVSMFARYPYDIVQCYK